MLPAASVDQNLNITTTKKHSMLICLKRNCQTVGFECYQRHFKTGCCQTQNKHKTFKTVSENAIKDILKQDGHQNKQNTIKTVLKNAVRDSQFECCQRQ